MILGLEIGMVVAGLIALVTGKLAFSPRMTARGAPARIAGVVLLLPLPLAFTAGFLIALLSGPALTSPSEQASLRWTLVIVELVIVVACFVLATVIAVAFREPAQVRPPRRGPSRPAREAEELPEALPAAQEEGIQQRPRAERRAVAPGREEGSPRRRPARAAAEDEPSGGGSTALIVIAIVAGFVVLTFVGLGVWAWTSWSQDRAAGGGAVSPLPGRPAGGQPIQPPGGGPAPREVRAELPDPPEPPWDARPPFAVDPKLLARDATVYLTDMQEFDVKQGPWPLGKHGNLGDPGRRRIVVNGTKSPYGLGLHPPDHPNHARVRYALGKKAQVFKATVAFNDAPGEGGPGPARFLVLGDGKELWRSKVLRMRNTTEDCVVDVSNVNVLELRVRGEGGVYGSHAVWIEPRLLTRRDGGGGESPAPGRP